MKILLLFKRSCTSTMWRKEMAACSIYSISLMLHPYLPSALKLQSASHLIVNARPRMQMPVSASLDLLSLLPSDFQLRSRQR